MTKYTDHYRWRYHCGKAEPCATYTVVERRQGNKQPVYWAWILSEVGPSNINRKFRKLESAQQYCRDHRRRWLADQARHQAGIWP
jgi:hypothetical protein